MDDNTAVVFKKPAGKATKKATRKISPERMAEVVSVLCAKAPAESHLRFYARQLCRVFPIQSEADRILGFDAGLHDRLPHRAGEHCTHLTALATRPARLTAIFRAEMLTVLTLNTTLQLCVRAHLHRLPNVTDLTLWFFKSGQLVVDAALPPTHRLASLSLFFVKDACTPHACLQARPTAWWRICRRLDRFETNASTPLFALEAYFGRRPRAMAAYETSRIRDLCIYAMDEYCGDADDVPVIDNDGDPELFETWTGRGSVNRAVSGLRAWIATQPDPLDRMVLPNGIHLDALATDTTRVMPSQPERTQIDAALPDSWIWGMPRAADCCGVNWICASDAMSVDAHAGVATLLLTSDVEAKAQYDAFCACLTSASRCMIVYHAYLARLLASPMSTIGTALRVAAGLFKSMVEEQGRRQIHVFIWPSPSDVFGDNGHTAIASAIDATGERYARYSAAYATGGDLHQALNALIAPYRSDRSTWTPSRLEIHVE